MTAAEVEAPTQAMGVEQQARIVSDLLREYAAKLVTLNHELWHWLLSDYSKHGPDQEASRAAWLLDQSEFIRKPLVTILNRASGLQEQSPIGDMTDNELELRRIETEIHLHHMSRLAHELRGELDKKRLTANASRLRMASGLSGMKGGPLRPN